MQGLSAKGLEGESGVRPKVGRLGLEARPVDLVTQERVTDRGEVNTDLMGAPGLEPAGQQAGHRRAVGSLISLDELPMRYRLAAAFTHRHLVAGTGAAVDRLVDGAARPVGRTPDECHIGPSQ